MRWLLSFTVAFIWSVVVQAKSFTGSRLLVVLEEQTEREQYSVFLEDLTCKLDNSFNGARWGDVGSQDLHVCRIGFARSPVVEL